MKASETKIDRFLATSETTFAIPVYQRNYDWTIKECQQLFNDIIRIGSNNENAHFIGSIVYVHDDVYSATGLNELTIIDGQQRLTTITLIYSALFRLAKQMGDNTLVNRIQKMYLINEFAPETEKLKLKPSEQNNIYKNYWEVIERNAKDETLNISMVSDFIRDFLTLKNKEIPNKKDVYNIKTKNRIYFLERLENFQNQEPVVIEGNEKITIEHIFPQNPDPKWKFDLKEEYNFIRDNYLNIIGNLTLSGNNGKLSNKPFIEKRDMNEDNGEQGYKFSRLWLNRDLKEIEVWNKTEIEIGQRSDVSSAKEFYISVFKQLFELSPDVFFNTNLKERITTLNNIENSGREKDYEKLNDTYYFYTNITNTTKFERIKEALTLFGCEDELSIKYAAKQEEYISEYKDGQAVKSGILSNLEL